MDMLKNNKVLTIAIVVCMLLVVWAIYITFKVSYYPPTPTPPPSVVLSYGQYSHGFSTDMSMSEILSFYDRVLLSEGWERCDDEECHFITQSPECSYTIKEYHYKMNYLLAIEIAQREDSTKNFVSIHRSSAGQEEYTLLCFGPEM